MIILVVIASTFVVVLAFVGIAGVVGILVWNILAFIDVASIGIIFVVVVSTFLENEEGTSKEETRPGVNFTNILRAPFSYKSGKRF